MKIDIGAGNITEDGWTKLDPVHGQGEWKRKAEETPWPIGDNEVKELRASHVMEHIHAGQDRIKVMNEAYRVLQPGGTFEIIVPLIVARNAGEQLGWWAIADPTHVSYWVEESFHYFDGHFAANADYGIKIWETVSLNVLDGWEGHWVGQKPFDG